MRNRSFLYVPVNSDNTCQSLTIPSELAAARQVEQCLLARLREYQYPDECLFAIRLALEEALSNAIKHGNRLDPEKSVCVRFSVKPQQVQIRIRDQGSGFDPSAVPDPTSDEHLEDPGGRGIMLMRAYMDEVSYNLRGNEICMVKRIGSSGI